MKRFLGLIILVYALPGCHNFSKHSSNNDDLTPLPPEVAGTWKSEGHLPCTITLTPQGKVSWAITSLGQMKITPNQTTHFEMIDGQISTVIAGECPVDYDPETRELSVTIFISDMDIKIANDCIVGSNEDNFFGPVSKDGKTWNTTWINIFDYGPRFPQSKDDIEGVPLKFEKVAELPRR